jgi:SWI/SNF-related matrix-associated actin-dependent regulator 1 of chromatin subfamily A
VVSDGRDAVIPLPKVTILSYGLVTQGSPIMTYISGQAAAAQVGSKKKDGKQQEKQQQQQVQPQQQVQQRFGMVIVDESHYLKDSSTQRCKLLTPILHGAPHCVLLSGTPATNRPVDLFPQLHILSPAAFPSFFPFAERFCGAKRNRFGGWDFSGSTNQAELRGLLAPIMIRRLKVDVLSQLPAKRRHRVVLTLCKEAAVQMEGQKKALEQQASNLDDALSGRGGGGGGGGGGGAHDDNRSGRSEASSLRFDGLKLLGEFYNSTGAAKVAPVCTYLSELINGGAEKLIVFGHHLVVLDGLEQGLASQQVKLIRLDGSNSYDERHAAVARFQKDDTVQVALLSMTACGVGLTLTAASTVVFAELHWNPGTLSLSLSLPPLCLPYSTNTGTQLCCCRPKTEPTGLARRQASTSTCALRQAQQTMSCGRVWIKRCSSSAPC